MINNRYENFIVTSEEYEIEKNYWLQQLSGLSMTHLMYDHGIQSSEGKHDEIHFQFSAEIFRGIHNLAKGSELATYMILLAGIKYILSIYTCSEDVLVISPIFKQKVKAEFINNILPLRTQLNVSMSFKELLLEVKKTISEATKHQNYPIYKIIELLNYPISNDVFPLTDVMVMLENIHDQEYISEENFNISYHFLMTSETLGLVLRYNPNLFDADTMKRILDHLVRFLEICLISPEITLVEVEMISAEEKQKVLFEFNDSETDFPREKTILQLFAEQVERSPEQNALVFADQQMTYQELHERSNRLACVLREKGVKPEQIVGIMVEPGLEMFIGIMAILKAGGAYLPIDPTIPLERINYMLRDSQSQFILTQSHLTNRFLDVEVMILDKEEDLSNAVLTIDIVNQPHDLAYVIYTSGSTGKPKGVLIEHRSLINFSCWHKDYYQITPADHSTKFAGFSFDASVGEIFPYLIAGATIYIIPEHIRLDVNKINEFFEENQITIAFLPTQFCEQFMLLENHSLRVLLTAGEKLKFYHPGGYQLVNNYGPTENTVCTTYFSVEQAYHNIPIGKPLNNTQVFIFDQHNRLQPIGISGELCISGDGLARGYLNLPELTESKFVANPYTGNRMYRTGDLARWQPNGNIEFLGRIDYQIKIRGFRIEIGEIENQLLNYDLVKEAVVVDRQDEHDEKYLCAYIVANDELSIADLREYLKNSLPDYMIPSYFMKLDKIPLTLNGKIDKRALPEPELTNETEYVPPTNEIEKVLVKIWSEFLGVERIGINDDFFALGGHSLKATMVINKISNEFAMDIPVRQIFDDSTIKKLARFIEENEKTLVSAIRPQQKQSYYPVSHAQKRLWVIDKLDKSKNAYNIPIAVILTGNLNRKVLEQSLQKIVENHESLRTFFSTVDEEPVQIVVENYQFNLTYIEQLTTSIQDCVNQEAQTPFDLTTPGLLRAALAKINAEEHLFMLTMHHIIADGFSMNILLKELFQIYTAYIQGQALPLQSSPIQYRDYAIWQNGDVFKEKLAKQEEYWLSQFSGELPVLDLPIDYPRPLVKSFRGATINFEFDITTSQKVEVFNKSRKVTNFMTLLTAFNILLYKYTGSTDLIVGSPIAGRHYHELENIIGVFVNTLAWRTGIKPKESFVTHLERVSKMVIDGYANQDYPFDTLVDNLELSRDMSRNPLSDVMFSWQNMSVSAKPEVKLSDDIGLGMRLLTAETVTSKFDLIMTLNENNGILHGSIEYSTDLFHEEKIQRMVEHFKVLLRDIVAHSESNLADLNMLSSEEKTKLITMFNDTQTEYPRDKTIVELFEEQVAKTPDQVAVKFGVDQLTYWELNERANQLTHLLVSCGVKIETPIGLVLDRSLDMIIGLVASLKAGGAYLPIDPVYPKERITFMLQDGEAPVVIVQTHLRDKISSEYHGKVIQIDQPQQFINKSAENLCLNIKPDNLACIIYTSGSTGKPKGTLICQRGVVRLVRNTNYIKIYPTDHMLQLPSYSFDVSIFDIWGALLNGARLVLIEKEKLLAIQELADLLVREKITVLSITTALFNSMADFAPQSFRRVRKILFGGEKVSVSHVQKVMEFVQPGTLLHAYGPTENTTVTTVYEITELEKNAATISIGKPISNTKVYILDEYLNPMPVGVKGELYTSGDGLAKGYLNRPELTAERFIANPFVPGEIMYKTGDIAKYLPDGNIIFVDRADQQVKIRGFRIEPGEIKNVLIKYPDITDVVVIPKDDLEGNKYLIAYIVSERELLNSELRNYLLERLPEYMVPALFVQMAKFPLTKNGKIDYKALPDPKELTNQSAEFVAPRNNKEEVISGIWSEVLGIKKVGVYDNFFEMGGDSLKAIQAVARLNRVGLQSNVGDIFRYQTVGEVAKYATVRENQVNAGQGIVSGEVLPTPIIHWFIDQNFAEAHYFNQSVYVKVPENIDPEILEEAFGKLIEHHDGLRLNYKAESRILVYGNQYFNEGFNLIRVDLSMYSKEEQARKLEEIGIELKSGFDLENTLLIKAALFKFSSEEYRLLITSHHLVVDGMSWRIIMEDLSKIYIHLARNEEVILPEKSSSFKVWSERIYQYSQSKKLNEETPYWQEVMHTQYPLPIQNIDELTCFGDIKTLTASLSKNDTKLLLTEAQKAYNTEINDLLLTALAMTLSNWTGRSKHVISLEGHGREELFDDIEVYRTVGWFTTIFPVKLDLTGVESISEQIKAIKEQVHKIPNKGLGYGVLKYLTGVSLPFFDERFTITFNYMGQYNNSSIEASEKDTTTIFDGVPANTGLDIGRRNNSLGVLDFGGEVIEGRLNLSLGYNQNKIVVDVAKELLSNYVENLIEIINHCSRQTYSILTPSDIELVELDQRFLDTLVMEHRIMDIYPLSPMQEGMLYHYLLDYDSQNYFEQVSYRIEGDLNLKRFEEAWNYVIQNNEIFRTVFRWIGTKKPVQIVLQDMYLNISFENLSEVALTEREQKLTDIREKDRQKQFDLAQGPNIRVIVVKLEDYVHEIIWSFHHILIDGWCNRFIMKELFTAYQQLEKGVELYPLNKYKYKNYIRYILQKGEDELYHFWKEYLKNFEFPTALPTDYLKKQEIHQVGQAQIHFTYQETENLVEFAKNKNITINSVVQTGLGILFQKYNNSKDVVFGAVVSGRPASLPGVEEMIGLFINTVPVRVKNDAHTQVNTLLHQIYQQSIVRQEFEHASLVDIKTQCGVNGQTSLFDCVIAYENFEEGIYNSTTDSESSKTDLELKVYSTSGFEQTNYDLAFRVSMGECMIIEGQYNEDLFKYTTIHRLLEHFKNIILNIVNNSEQEIRQINMLSDIEKDQVIYKFNNTKVGYLFDKCYHQLFEEQVERTPDQVAVIFREQKLSYQELNVQANRIAHLLMENGVKPETIIGLMVDRSLEMVSGMLGILKSGGAYLPIDPVYPEERINYMLKDAQTPILLTLSHLRGLIPVEYEGKIFFLDCMDELDRKDIANPVLSITQNNLAYVIYTSGSTGQPKGTLIEHMGLSNLVQSYIEALEIKSGDSSSLYSSFGFDAITLDIHPFLVVGGSVNIVPDEVRYSIYGLKNWFKENGITTAFLPTALVEEIFKKFTPDELSLKTLVIGGSFLKYIPTGKWEVTLYNVYGATEDSVLTTYFNISNNQDIRPIPIGKPFNNYRVYILDTDGNPAPIGVAGELCLAGVGVARGYLNQPELTLEKFLEDPFVPGERMYKSGDVGKWLPDGNLEFLGRIDNQVKIRGFRIELNELETILLKHSAVKEAYVIDRLNQQNERYLAAYIVADGILSNEDLRNYLLQNLPYYFVPSVFVMMDKLPLNHNGKVDRKALPEPEMGDLQIEYVAPRTSLEKKLAKIWTEVLNIDKIGINDDFFERGGHSLKGIQLMSRVFEECDVELPIMFLYENSTIKEMAEALENRSSSKLRCVMRLRKGTTARNIYCVHPSSARPTGYQLLANLISSEYNVYGIQALGTEDKNLPLPKSVEEMAKYYISEIKAVQVEGPYSLIGYSGGAHIVYEIARQLELNGDSIARLIILDIPPFQEELLKDGTTVEEEVKKLAVGFANLDYQTMGLNNMSLEETLAIVFKVDIFKQQYSNITLNDLYKEKDIILNINECCSKYKPQSIIDADIYLFKAENTHFNITLEDWRIWTKGQVYFSQISGNHYTVLQSPHVEMVVEKLNL